MSKLKTIQEEIVSPFLDTDAAAHYLLMSPKTLKNHRSIGSGPKYRKHGGRVAYHKEDLDQWSEERKWPRS